MSPCDKDLPVKETHTVCQTFPTMRTLLRVTSMPSDEQQHHVTLMFDMKYTAYRNALARNNIQPELCKLIYFTLTASDDNLHPLRK